MINHFRTWLLNRPAAFFEESLFPVHVDPSFTPSPWNTVTREIDRILFGANPDASLLDYRFFQFLRVIGACRFRDHVRRFDPRETYRPDLGEFHHDSLYASSVVPAQGLSVTEEHTPEFLRKTLTVLVQEDRMIVSGDDGRPVPVTLLSSKSVRIDSLGLVLSAARDGFWRVDYRKRPGRPLGDLVREIDDLPVTVLKSLFDQTKETAPEYEEGFRTITDSLSRFCMVLFACTVAQERMRHDWDKAPKRIEQEAVDLSGDAPGTFYYGFHPKDFLRMQDIRTELRYLTGVRHRRQTVEFAVPQTAYLYLVWPARFGLPPRNRIIVDGLLNSAWTVSPVSDREEQYVVFRSEHKIRTDTPVRIEIP